MVVLWLLGVGDEIYSLLYKYSPYITNMTRPFVVLVYLSQSRSHVKSILHLINDSLATLVSIMAFVGIYSFLGYLMFKNTLQG